VSRLLVQLGFLNGGIPLVTVALVFGVISLGERLELGLGTYNLIVELTLLYTLQIR
jgi:hypothetical protein